MFQLTFTIIYYSTSFIRSKFQDFWLAGNGVNRDFNKLIERESDSWNSPRWFILNYFLSIHDSWGHRVQTVKIHKELSKTCLWVLPFVLLYSSLGWLKNKWRLRGTSPFLHRGEAFQFPRSCSFKDWLKLLEIERYKIERWNMIVFILNIFCSD